ncbi:MULTISPECIES: glycosyl hydrolase family 28-related protein [unclassified Methanoculleus]|uniref:glycosyl hydrolase family 28-related protein n=1 Tax=unclassified Methanoculleus TaxID=2619537 RepID=UPI0025E37AD4|nr:MULTISPECIES: glycosyl hydrolase family 28-related protein [unclassified Methanoculleus]
MITRLHEKPADPPRTRPPGTELAVGVIITLLLVQGVAAAPVAALVVAAGDSSPAAKAQADYACDGLDDQVEIQAALAALPDGGTVVLSEGTFNCSGSIVPAAGTTVKGQGPEKTSLEFSRNGILNVSEERVTLDGFRIAGSGYVNASTDTVLDLGQWLGVLTVYASHAKIHNVTGTGDASIQAVFLLLHNPNVYAPVLEDVEFVDCRAVDTGTYGFLHNAWGSENTTIKNISYENCAAINCGRNGAFNPWVTGFDFAELNDIEGLRVTDCLAEGSLESGFHFEWSPEKRDCVFVNCTSRNNGQKPGPDDYLLGDPDFFGAGFYLPGGQVSLVNCRAEGNGAFGFFIINPDGMLLYNCTESGTGRDSVIAKPISYCILQSLPVSRSPSLVMDHCRSLDSNGWALFVCGTDNALIRDFTMANPAGIDGIGAILGCPSGELPVNSTIDAGVSNSIIDLAASGDRPQTLVYIVNNRNVTYSGRVASDAARPVVVEWTLAGGADLTDLEVLPAGSMA